MNPRLSDSAWYQFQLDFVRCLWAMLPATCLWGASFPLTLAAVASKGADAGVVVGRTYAANTVGGIVGAVGMSLVVIAWIGTQNGERILIGLSAASAALALLPRLLTWRPPQRLPRWEAVAGLAILELAMILGRNIVPVPAHLVGHGRLAAAERKTVETFLFVGEGMNSSPAVSRDLKGTLSYYNAGKIQASSLPQDMRLQRMLGHLTTLIPTIHGMSSS